MHYCRVTNTSRLSILLLLLWAAPAAAQVSSNATPAAPSYPNVKVGGTLFVDYSYFAAPEIHDADGNAVNLNSFNIARSYINVTGNLSKLIAFRFTPDIAQETGAGSALNGSLTFRVKYAYLQTNFDQWMPAGSYARFGMQGTGFVNFAEDLYRYRFQGPIMVDREAYLLSSDAGAAFHYNMPNNWGDVHVGVYNGETYKKFEINDQKAMDFRGTVRPFPKAAPALRGLRVTGFYHLDHYVAGAPRNRAMGSVTYEHKYVNAAIDYLNASDQTTSAARKVNSSGYSFWITPRSPQGWEGLFRHDHLNVDESRDQVKDRTIVGGAYWFPVAGGASTALLLDYEQVSYDRFIPSKPAEKRIALHALLQF
jgi:hypothetical protein